MRVEFGFLCDSAMMGMDGRISMLGQFDAFTVPTFPAMIPRVTMVAVFSAKVDDTEKPEDVTIEFIGADGEVIGTSSAPIVVPNPNKIKDKSEVVKSWFINGVSGLVLQKPGRYGFRLKLKDREPYDIMLTARQHSSLTL